ncbi:hypothetical protein KGF57_000930 [Candida theae]|uniref:Uncharacterized protein n=1 Tax=Candida theae TaxID=1198502 RepID=A0AAD5BHS9_9ASCO|nr:uncharacterized protein KGF57_000930 [Candida theae]KAI5964438.1 hypothetical protein KGF57_000930 [Candida theae]
MMASSSTSGNYNKSFRAKLKSIKKELISTTNTLTRSKSTFFSSSPSPSTPYPCSIASLSSPYSSLQPSPFTSTNTSPRSIVSSTFATSSFVQSTPELNQEQQQSSHSSTSSSSSTIRYRSHSISHSFSKFAQNINNHSSVMFKSGSHFHLPLTTQQRQQGNNNNNNNNNNTAPLAHESIFDTCIPLDYDHFTYTNTTDSTPEDENDDDDGNLDGFNINQSNDNSNANYYNNNSNVISSFFGEAKEEVIIPPLPDIHEFNPIYQQQQQQQQQRHKPQRHQLHHQSSTSSIMTSNSDLHTTTTNNNNNNNNNSNTTLNRHNSAIRCFKQGGTNMTQSASFATTNTNKTYNSTPNTPVSLTHSKTNTIDVCVTNEAYINCSNDGDGAIDANVNEIEDDILAINILNLIRNNEIVWDI